MRAGVYYKKRDDCYYKINSKLKRITKIENNEVSYLDYDANIVEIGSYKKIQMNQWKHVENSFFISRDFEWEFNKEKYRTNNKPIKWIKGQFGDNSSVVFHNGKIWEVSMSGNYYPRVFLEREVYQTPTRKVLVEKNEGVKHPQRSTSGKWTDIKYCRNFEKIS
jgi:hypothetical protein